MVIAKVYKYVKSFSGIPTSENFKLVDETLGELKDEEFFVEAAYLSVDPYMRVYPTKVNETMIGTQVGKIIESKSSKFPVGKYVVGYFGWRTHTIVKEPSPNNKNTGLRATTLLPFDTNVSLALGVLGMPGNTAYFGLLELCRPKAGETVVVSGAAGAVGNHVGQIAKIKGCKVIGICGTDEKGKWLKSLGFDDYINYKTDDICQKLLQLAPNGVDCYFDNVGGDISSIVTLQMNRLGRIAICGSISSYNTATQYKEDKAVEDAIASRQLDRQRLKSNDYADRWNEAVEQNRKWIQEGKLKYKETITEGFENMPQAFIGLFEGANTGKAIVKV